MPCPRAAMRKIREALRLCLAEGLSPRRAGIATGLPRTSVRRYLVRAIEVGLSWPLPSDLDDRELEERLYGRAAPAPSAITRPVPDWSAVHRELARKGVTLQLLRTEYRVACPDGFGYTWFTERYRAYVGWLDLVLRHDHRAGEKAFIDFAGRTIQITDPLTGEMPQAQLFAAVSERRTTRTPKSRSSTPRRPSWPPSTAAPSSRLARTSRGTRRRSKSASSSPNAGSQPPSGTGRSFPWPRRTGRSASASPG